MSVAELQARASIELEASPERVFAALISSEVTRWWVRPGVFDTREWTADVRPGGTWRASGIGRGNPYALEGEFASSTGRASSYTRGILPAFRKR